MERIGNPVRIGSEPIAVSSALNRQLFSPRESLSKRMGRPRKRGTSQKTYLGSQFLREVKTAFYLADLTDNGLPDHFIIDPGSFFWPGG
jgi:hypothetical protein